VFRNDKGDMDVTGIFATPYHNSRRDCNYFETEIRSTAIEITLHYYMYNKCENKFSLGRPWREENTTYHQQRRWIDRFQILFVTEQKQQQEE